MVKKSQCYLFSVCVLLFCDAVKLHASVGVPLGFPGLTDVPKSNVDTVGDTVEHNTSLDKNKENENEKLRIARKDAFNKRSHDSKMSIERNIRIGKDMQSVILSDANEALDKNVKSDNKLNLDNNDNSKLVSLHNNSNIGTKGNIDRMDNYTSQDFMFRRSLLQGWLQESILNNTLDKIMNNNILNGDLYKDQIICNQENEAMILKLQRQNKRLQKEVDFVTHSMGHMYKNWNSSCANFAEINAQVDSVRDANSEFVMLINLIYKLFDVLLKMKELNKKMKMLSDEIGQLELQARSESLIKLIESKNSERIKMEKVMLELTTRLYAMMDDVNFSKIYAHDEKGGGFLYDVCKKNEKIFDQLLKYRQIHDNDKIILKNFSKIDE